VNELVNSGEAVQLVYIHIFSLPVTNAITTIVQDEVSDSG